jgi:hypothetical protein
MSQKMTLNEKVRQISRQLISSENDSELRLLRVLENLEVRVFSNRKQDFFLIPTNDEITEEIERVQGLYTMIKIYNLEKTGPQHFLQLRVSSDKRAIFSPFIAELISKNLSEPNKALNETLQEWRNLWRGGTGRLNEKQQRGLLGELIVLHELIKNGKNKTVKNWVGPLGNTHDFESSEINLEVKTTILQPPSVHISLIKQVAPMEGSKELDLIVIGLKKGEDINLTSEINLIREKLNEVEYLERFEYILKKAGYREQHSTFYDSSYSLAFIQKHSIDNRSPVLNPKLLSEIPSTVTNIRYTLEVHGMDMESIEKKNWIYYSNKME